MNQIDAVVARLVSKEYLASLIAPEGGPYCHKYHPNGCFCTREEGHEGFHVAHFPARRILIDGLDPWSDEECRAASGSKLTK